MSEPTLSDNDFKNEMALVWTILNENGSASQSASENSFYFLESDAMFIQIGPKLPVYDNKSNCRSI